MHTSRRDFIIGTAAALAGCASVGNGQHPRVAVQMYSIQAYYKGLKDKKTQRFVTEGVGFAQAFKDVAAIGYEGVEFAGYGIGNGKPLPPATLKAMLGDNGLVACGTHIDRTDLAPDKIKVACEYSLGLGNDLLICPGSGNRPEETRWMDGETIKDDWWKFLVEYYAKAAEEAASFGCKVGIHNHTWEFFTRLSDGTSVWDYFFSNAPSNVYMEQDVGWTVAAGHDPCEQYLKYPNRSPTLHAKENGCRCTADGTRIWADRFDAILGQPGRFADGTSAQGVDWDRLFKTADADGVKWYVVECERHGDGLSAIDESYRFLRSKGCC